MLIELLNGSRKAMLNRVVFASVAFFGISNGVHAADVTLVSGFYQKSSEKIDGKTKGSTSVFGAGGRFSDDLNTDMAWIGQGDLEMKSYTASAGIPSPDNALGMEVGGGVRYYFKPFAPAVVPYVSGIASVLSDKDVVWKTDGYVQTSTSGLYYGANAGIRAGLGGDVFIELEIPVFKSPLFAVTKEETVKQVGDQTTTTKEESTDTALYVSSVGKITDARLGIGMKL
jgi:hypothetical protein